MKQTYHFLSLIRQKLFKRERVPEEDTVIEQPEQPQENETVQNKEVIELSEQAPPYRAGQSVCGGVSISEYQA